MKYEDCPHRTICSRWAQERFGQEPLCSDPRCWWNNERFETVELKGRPGENYRVKEVKKRGKRLRK